MGKREALLAVLYLALLVSISKASTVEQVEEKAVQKRFYITATFIAVAVYAIPPPIVGGAIAALTACC
ncbi:hypothetical protein PoB_000770000 [Plakobranchus ocellatus]|uniref:Uncharacterized protein n=1 Tax=Plakobranchus ocellatus TaxID=259542 RepID=A0AAV3YEL9_9GAST|nr:hypothetical protein PoB_000770000 [Plakobranchus ocellatus]